MRYNEFLLEYNRDITKKNFGEKLLSALQKERPRDDNWNLLGDPVQRQNIIDAFIKQLEDADPTPHKEYVQWMARKYTDPKNLVRFEDYLGQLPMYLAKFHKLKQRRMIDNPRNDINRYDNVPDFMNVVDEYPDPDTAQAASQKGSATTYHEDKNLRIVEPRDQEAACYYGRGTRWCTAATVGKNYFLNYYKQGPLYILIPKQPAYEGEKYQFHFSTNSFMDDKDRRVSLKKQKELVQRFPNLGEIFSQQINSSHNGYWMKGGLTDKDRQKVIKSLKNNTVDMPDGSHVVYLNDDTEVEYLDPSKETRAELLFTNGLQDTDVDPDDTDLSNGGDGLPNLSFALFNKDFTDGLFVIADVNQGEVYYKWPASDLLNQDMPDDIKPVYNQLLKIVKDNRLDAIQRFDKIQKTFVPEYSRMDMRDIQEYLDTLEEGYTKNGQYRIRAMTYEQNHSPPHELRAFLAIPEVKKELDKLRYVIKNTPRHLLQSIPRAELVNDLMKMHNVNISPRGKELIYNYLKGSDQYLREESPDTFKGSLSPDQIKSRLWMSKKLNETNKDINNAIVLGSWYGLLPYILRKKNNIENITANDNIPGCVKVSKKLNPEVAHIVEDCNKLDMKKYDCVINPSVNNISGDSWYKNIKPGTLCLFQTEDISVNKGCPKNLEEMKKKYPLREYLYEGILKSTDKDGKFKRSMIIGYK